MNRLLLIALFVASGCGNPPAMVAPMPDLAFVDARHDAGAPDLFSCSPVNRCDGVCVDLQTDAQHCGACDTPCTLGEQCVSGQCVAIPCPKCKCQGTIGMPGLPLSNWGPNAIALATGDFDGDGRLDLAAADYKDAGLLFCRKNGTFKAGPTVTPDPGPVDVAAADLDGDGHLDMAIVSAGANTVDLFWGDGAGRLSMPQPLATELGPVAIVIGDFNKDGKPDIAVACSGANVVSVILNRGKRQFAGQIALVAGSAPMGVVSADFDGDGKPDLATADSGSGTISVLLGKGDGTFAAPIASVAGDGPGSPIAADFDGDGRPDMAVANPNVHAASVLINSGHGGFAAPVAYSFTAVDRIAAGDLDGNGAIDLLALATGAGRLGVFLNDGSGKLGPAAGFIAGQNPSALALGDYNGDGHLDVAIANPNYGVITVLAGDGKGAFADPSLAATPGVTTNSAAAADLDGDQTPDLVLTEGGGLAVLLNRSGGLTSGTSYSAGPDATSIAIADFNGDGRPDLVTANADPTAEAGTLSLLLNTGAGAFGGAMTIRTAQKPTSVTAADFNGDGSPDLAATCLGAGSVQVFLNDKSGNFGQPVMVAPCMGPAWVAAGDVNGDGKVDLAIACVDGQGSAVLFNDGKGGFGGAPMSVYTGTRPSWIALADFNGDGKLDFLTRSDASIPSLNVTLSDGMGGYALPEMVTDSEGPYASAVVGDFDGDGLPDVATVHSFYPSAIGVHLNRLANEFVPAGLYPAGADAISFLAAADFDGDGALDVAAGNAANAWATILLQRCLP